MQGLARLVEIQESDMLGMKQALAWHPKEKTPTEVLWRVFRCSNAIQNTIEYLQLQCSQKDKEFGFAVDPTKQIRGHDVQGDPVEWIPCPEKDHMICALECQECFLVMIDEALEEKITALESELGIPPTDITIAVSTSQMKRCPPDTLIREFPICFNHSQREGSSRRSVQIRWRILQSIGHKIDRLKTSQRGYGLGLSET